MQRLKHGPDRCDRKPEVGRPQDNGSMCVRYYYRNQSRIAVQKMSQQTPLRGAGAPGFRPKE